MHIAVGHNVMFVWFSLKPVSYLQIGRKVAWSARHPKAMLWCRIKNWAFPTRVVYPRTVWVFVRYRICKFLMIPNICFIYIWGYFYVSHGTPVCIKRSCKNTLIYIGLIGDRRNRKKIIAVGALRVWLTKSGTWSSVSPPRKLIA